MIKWFKKADGKAKNENNHTDVTETPEEAASTSGSNPEDSPHTSDDIQQAEISDAEAAGEGVSDILEKTKLPGRKKPWSLKKKIIVSATGVLGAVIIGCGVWLATLFVDPLSGFKTVPQQVSRPPASAVLQPADGNVTAGATPTPTPNPYDVLMAQSDPTILDQTVNILLIGVDYAPERDDWSGKHYFHSDVMIVLAINRETGSVNLISLPRDTYVDMPGVDGIYKLNASMDCGGGWKDNPAGGCQEVCKAASWMIGGIPVDYYYAVDMTALKGLVDAIGGVDFNIQVPFDIAKRYYKAGMQHMDGQAVLDFVRARKEMGDESGDLNRINRQKDMLIAVLQKLKDTGLIFKVPDIIAAFTGNLQTNVDFQKSCRLAAYASTIDTSKIKLYSMDGSYAYSLFNWNFVITDQNKRVQIIKDVYGFDITSDADVATLESRYGIKIPSYSRYSMKHALGDWEKMEIEVSGKQARKLLDQVKSTLDADALLKPYPTPAPPDPAVTIDPSAPPTPPPTPVPSDGYRIYPADGEVWALYNKAENDYTRVMDWNTSGATKTSHAQFQDLLEKQLHADVQAICVKFGIKKDWNSKNWEDYWHVDYGDHPKKTSVNQHYVKNDIPVDFN